MFHFRASIVILLISTAIIASAAKPKLNINVQDKAVVKGILKISATVDSTALVDRVSFLVDKEQRSFDQSTPYEYAWDTVAETEGDHVLEVDINSSDGKTTPFIYHVKVDNELNKGVDYHLGKGREALGLAKFEDALVEGKTVLKIKEDSSLGQVLIGRAYLGMNETGNARRAVELALLSDPKNTEANDLLALILLRKARLSSDPKDVKEAFIQAVQARYKSIDLQIAALSLDKDAGKIFDLQFLKGDYQSTIAPLKRLVQDNPKDTLTANRLLYAYIRNGQLNEAKKLGDQVVKRTIDDDYTHSMLAITASMEGHLDAANSEINKSVKINAEAPVIKMAQAYLAAVKVQITKVGETPALRFQRKRYEWTAVLKLMNDLINSSYTYPEVYFYQESALNQLDELDRADDSFKNAIYQEPALVELFVTRAYENLDMSLDPRFANLVNEKQEHYTSKLYADAQRDLETVYAVRDSSVDALAGMALTLSFKGDYANAIKYAAGIMNINYERSWPYIAAAATYENAYKQFGLASAAKRRQMLSSGATDKALADFDREFNVQQAPLERKALEAQKHALELDPEHVTGLQPFELSKAFNFVRNWGRPPVVVRPLTSKNASSGD